MERWWIESWGLGYSGLKIEVVMPYKDPEKRKKYSEEYGKRHYRENRALYRQRSEEHKRRLYEWFWDLKASLKCEECDENHPACLDFHHKDPKEKDLDVATLVNSGLSRQRILDEIDKCRVLCANCHRKLHCNRSLV